MAPPIPSLHRYGFCEVKTKRNANLHYAHVPCSAPLHACRYTVGYGDITPVSNIEKIFNILLFVVGTGVVAMVIVYVNDIVCQLDVTSDIYKMRLERVQSMMIRESFPAALKAKVCD